MSSNLSDLYRLKRKDIKKAREVTARAFDSDPLINYMFPSVELKETQMPHYHRFMLSYGLIYGEIYASSPKIEGLATWYLSDKYKMNLLKQLRAGGMRFFMKLSRETLKRIMPRGKFSAEMHHKYANFKHWSLSPIGVDPVHQGKGYGGTLIRAMLKRIDNENLPCVLETQNPVNVEIYKRFDFEVAAEEVIPNTELSHWLMVRQPKKE
jgi:ribosomal protein S18 acetylase RimI-like enzyme